MTTIVVAFEKSNHALDAVRQLKEYGFTDDHIGIASSDLPDGLDETGIPTETEATTVLEEVSATTAAAGAISGLGIGTLWGLGVVAGALPDIGPAILGGTLGVILSNAAVGTAAASLTAALVGFGIAHADAADFEKRSIQAKPLFA